jgi:hypothetical protein
VGQYASTAKAFERIAQLGKLRSPDAAAESVDHPLLPRAARLV